MQMRISVTDLEAFRYYTTSEDMTLSAFLRRLLRLEPPSEKMQAGIAFHKILEKLSKGEVVSQPEPGVYEYDGWFFDTQGITIRLQKPDCHEIKLERSCQINGHAVTLVGIADALLGNQIIEYKTTYNLDMPRHMDSLQWRAYCVMFGHMARSVRFEFFHLRPGHDPQHIWVKDQSWALCHRYLAIEQDVQRALTEYMDFLEHLIRQRYLHVHMGEKIRLEPGSRLQELEATDVSLQD